MSLSFRTGMIVLMQLICTLISLELMNRKPDNIKIIVKKH